MPKDHHDNHKDHDKGGHPKKDCRGRDQDGWPSDRGGLPPEIVASVAIANVKAVAEQPALLSNLNQGNLVANVNLAQQNGLSQQQAMNDVLIAVTGKTINLVTNLSPLESMATLKLVSGNDLAQQLADLRASLHPLTEPVPLSGS